MSQPEPLPAVLSRSFPRPFSLWWIEFLRILRGRRWRSLVLLSLVGAYWFGRQGAFGNGSLVWFPGAEQGVVLLALLFTFAAVVLGTNALGQWERHRAARFLRGRLNSPATWTLARIAATATACLPLAAMLAYWAAVGAWRADYQVLWLPNGIFLLAGCCPLVLAGAAAGQLSRAFFRNDLAALGLGAVLVAPLLYYRLSLAPILEVFEFASASLGILVPAETLWREGLICYGYAALLAGCAALSLPVRPDTSIRKRPFWHLDIPWLRVFLRRLFLQIRSWRPVTALGALILVAAGVAASREVILLAAAQPREIDWAGLGKPQNVYASQIPSARIQQRTIRLPGGEGRQITVEMRISPSGDASQQAAVFTFGEAMDVKSVEGAEYLDDYFGKGVPYSLFLFDPPLMPGENRGVSVQVEPTKAGDRLWERAHHPRFYRFAALGPWFGESASLSFDTQTLDDQVQRAPYRVNAPNVSPLNWVSGGAGIRETGDGRIEIRQPRQGSPDRLIAADLISVTTDQEDLLPVEFLLLPSRETLAQSLHLIWAAQLERLSRLFGEPAETVVLYEVPEQNPSDRLAMPSAQLDLFEALLPNYGDYQRDTSRQFQQAFGPYQEGMIREIILKNFAGFEFPELLRDGLITYLHQHALAEGRFGAIERSRQEYVLIPWDMAKGRGYPFDIKKGNVEGWKGPAFEELRSEEDGEVPQDRLLAFHHMLRGVIGDLAYRRAIYNLIQDRRGEELTLDAYRKALEEEAGYSLEGFFHQWLFEGALPEFTIRKAQAVLMEDPETRALEYRTEVTLANQGTGLMKVPWVLATEGKSLRGTEMLGEGDEKVIRLSTTDRPVVFEIDPSGWVAQIPPSEGRDATHPRVFFRSIKEI